MVLHKKKNGFIISIENNLKSIFDFERVIFIDPNNSKL